MKKLGTILGIIGGVIGVISSILVLYGGITTLHKINDLASYSMIVFSFVIFGLAVLGIMMSINSKKNSKKSGIILIVDAIIGLVFGTFYIVTSILFVLSGILLLISKNQSRINQ
ncbi:hypothetical protein JHL18_21090 [Clostridium sp. YIM B02505]|uniref:DUF4064 domain-containing protein n=1 Tax=Clostridium yunnanense TaxID=2800325 RepID=A0ABS1EUR1_9CLOT|nr:hypothetical protein [Clostridium yunnanense]MBK1813120.1 hypothetical protein [Clostridium yunnanense]